jgi:WhiB family transcriptional regulator, redox-sensing transcriptional regulator
MIHLEPEFWREGAACADRSDVDFFAPPDNRGQVERALAICSICPVIDDCLAFAIETNQNDGIWGGLTAKERLRIRRRWLEKLRRAS